MSTDTIGSGKDHTTHTDWWAAMPSTLTEVENGRSYGTFTITSDLTIGGKTATASFYIDLRPDTGESFVDSKDDVGFKLQYDDSQGVAIDSSTNYTEVNIEQEHFRLHQYQIKTTTAGYTEHVLRIAANNVLVQDCIFDNDGWYGYVIGMFQGAGTSSFFVNCLFIDRANGDGFACGSEANTINCSFWKVGSTGATGCKAPDGDDNVVINCAFFNFDTAMDDTSYYSSSTDYNATDDTAIVGSNSLDTLTAADQVIDVDDDFRLKSGSDLIGAGNTDSSFPNDILGTVRGTGTAGDIGCHEFVAAGGADLHIKVGGAWKVVSQASVKVGGAWKNATVWVKVGGTWKSLA